MSWETSRFIDTPLAGHLIDDQLARRPAPAADQAAQRPIRGDSADQGQTFVLAYARCPAGLAGLEAIVEYPEESDAEAKAARLLEVCRIAVEAGHKPRA